MIGCNSASASSTYVEIHRRADPGTELGAVEVAADGRVTVRCGTSPQGQGHETTWALLAATELGIPIEHVTVLVGDTDAVATGVGTFGSRSLQLGGMSVLTAARSVAEKARTLAAELLEANADDVVFDGDAGRFHVAGTPSVAVDWAAVVAAEGPHGLAVTDYFAPSGPTFPFGAHLAVVELDVETGEVRLVRIVTVDDAGTVVHPAIVEGQRHGGIAQGAAQALLEEFRYDADGNPLTTNLMDYPMISAAELPSFELRRPRDADAGEPARGQGHRRVRHHRLDRRRAQRGVRRTGAVRHHPHRSARHTRASVAGPARTRESR